ncbi:MAG: TlpA family protein disulfide reductase [Panacagrimonas sp.]|jgi:thiol-disulfide isomerase/thioredoxin|nr:TlpA disulfide reductase family protein [Panacagrimonas sp.]MCC2657470.1 TlpA family protein disulfide reductase [Panacagrimonas sp.]
MRLFNGLRAGAAGTALRLILVLLFGTTPHLTAAEAPATAPAAPARTPLLAFGAQAPDIAGLVLNGAPGTKLSQYRGRVVAVDFWATWCTPCLQSIPELDRVRTEIAEAGFGDRFEIVSVNVDDDIPKARRFLEKHPVGYPVIGDPIGIAMQLYGPWKLPATFLLTPEGKVHMIWLGYADYFPADIKKLALEMLRAQPPPATSP